jgi:hypothetical protein
MNFNSYFVRDDRLCGLVDKDKKDGATILFSNLLTRKFMDRSKVCIPSERVIVNYCMFYFTGTSEQEVGTN